MASIFRPKYPKMETVTNLDGTTKRVTVKVNGKPIYTLSKKWAVKYTDASGLEVGGCETTGFLDSTADQIRFIRPYNAASGLSQIILVANAILVLHLLVAEIITGDSDLNCEVYYRVVDTTP